MKAGCSMEAWTPVKVTEEKTGAEEVSRAWRRTLMLLMELARDCRVETRVFPEVLEEVRAAGVGEGGREAMFLFFRLRSFSRSGFPGSFAAASWRSGGPGWNVGCKSRGVSAGSWRAASTASSQSWERGRPGAGKMP